MEKLYTCELLTDVVLNSKLATEGNMTTLDYIPGSNFLGIVAGALYPKLDGNKSYDIFHSDQVLFGDAYICDQCASERSYPMPFSIFKPKVDKGDTKKRWVHHHLTPVLIASLTKDGIQLKQERAGYITPSGRLFDNATKSFALKSAHDPESRRSKEGAMFGFESLKKGQTFLFSVHFKDEKYFQEVNQALGGTRRIGKSKTAQYGQVEIKLLNDKSQPKQIASIPQSGFSLVYAESNLCFFNEYGQSTFQPDAEVLGVKGEIIWEKSQVRTYSYSPWNGKRGTSNTQRDCIAKGSVFYVKGVISSVQTSNIVGEYQAEGLGRVLYNPEFLQANESNAEWSFDWKGDKPQSSTESTAQKPTTSLGVFLKKKKEEQDTELAVSKAVQIALGANYSGDLFLITPNQWGGIRSYASNSTDMTTLYTTLFKGYLNHGVAYDRIWGKQNEKCLNAFERIFKGNKQYGPEFIAKYAAEMAKKYKNTKDSK